MRVRLGGNGRCGGGVIARQMFAHHGVGFGASLFRSGQGGKNIPMAFGRQARFQRNLARPQARIAEQIIMGQPIGLGAAAQAQLELVAQPLPGCVCHKILHIPCSTLRPYPPTISAIMTRFQYVRARGL